MADEVARTDLIFDASKAEQGAKDLQAAADAIIRANAAVEYAEVKVADTVDKSTTRRTVSRRAAAKTAQETAAIEAAAAAAGGDAHLKASDVVEKSLASQVRMMNNYARQWDPFIGAAERAQKQLENLMNVMERGGEDGLRAAGMIAEATARLNTAQDNLSLGANATKSLDALITKFAPAQASAKAMTAELAMLNQALELGVSIEGGYEAAWDRIIEKYDEGAVAARKAAEAQQELIAAGRAENMVAIAQANVTRFAGVLPDAGSITDSSVKASRNADTVRTFQEAMDAEAKSEAALADGMKALDASMAAAQAEIAGLTAKWAPATASAQAMGVEIASLNRAVELGIPIQGGYEAALQRITDQYDGTAVAALAAKEATDKLHASELAAATERQRLIDAGRAESVMTTSQQQANTFAGVQPGANSITDATVSAARASDSARVFQDQVNEEKALRDERERLIQQFNPMLAAQNAYANTITQVDRALALNVISEEQATLARLNAGKVLESHSTGLKNSAASAAQLQFATRQAEVQTIQFFSSIAAGQPIWMSFLQQGHQVIDVMAVTGTGFSAFGNAAKQLFGILATPVGFGIAAFTAIAGVIAGLSISAESTTRRIETLKNSIALINPSNSAGLADQAERVARTFARTSTTGISITDARAGASAMATATDGFKGTDQQMVLVLDTFAKLSTALGEATPDWKRLADAMKSPSSILEELSKKVSGLDDDFIRHIKLLEQQGDTGRAWTETLNRINVATKNLVDNQSPLEKSLIALHNAFGGTTQAGKSLSQTLGEDINSRLALVVSAFTVLIDLLNRIPKDVFSGIAASLLELMPVLGPLNNALSGLIALKNNGLSVLQGAGALVGIGSGPTSAQPGGASGPVRGYDVNTAASVVAALVAKGTPQLDAIALAAMNAVEAGGMFKGAPVGDLKIPAGVDPTYGPYPGGSHGGFQWNRGRLANFMRQNNEMLPEQTERDTQLDFARTELATTHKRVADAAALSKDLAQTTTIYTAGFEGPANLQGEIPKRVAVAQNIQNAVSGGAGGAGTTVTPPPTAPIAAGGAAGADPYGTLSKSTQGTIKELEDLNKQYNVTGVAAQDLGARQEMLSRIINAGGKIMQGDTVVYELNKDQLDKAKIALGEVTGALYTNRTAQEQNQHTMELSADLAQNMTEGDLRRAQVVQRINELEKEHPGTKGAQDYANALATLNKEQEGRLRQSEFAIDRQIIGNQKLAEATLESGAAAQKATADQKAFDEASKLFAAGTPEWHAAFTRLSDDYLKAAQSAGQLQIAQQIHANDNQLKLIQAETAALGSNDQARVMMLANLKAEQVLKDAGISQESKFGQAYLASVAAITAQGYALAQQKAGIDAIAGSFSQSFDTIGNAMAQAFVQGQGAAVNWKNTMASVIQQVMQQLLKLSVLNPLMNKLFGQNNPTLQSGLEGMMQGGGGWMGGALRWLSGGSTAAGAASFAPSAADAATFAAQDVAPNLFMDAATSFVLHGGGIAGNAGTLGYVHPAYFDNAPRYHMGLKNDEVAAILLKNERVLTVEQTKSFDKMVKMFGGMQAALHHSGGLAGHHLTSRSVSAELFATAPRFHGGFANDDIAELLDKGIGSMTGPGGGGYSRSAANDDPGDEGSATHVTQNVHFHMPGMQNSDTFRRSMPQIISSLGKATRQQLQRSRN